jgi:hypothetical protein
MGRSLLKGKTPLLVTHLIQNEKWLNDQIGLFQAVADEAKKAEDITGKRVIRWLTLLTSTVYL